MEFPLDKANNLYLVSGRVTTAEPKFYAASDNRKAMLKFSIATNERFENEPRYLDVSVFQDTATQLRGVIHKTDRILAVGIIENRPYKDKIYRGIVPTFLTRQESPHQPSNEHLPSANDFSAVENDELPPF